MVGGAFEEIAAVASAVDATRLPPDPAEMPDDVLEDVLRAVGRIGRLADAIKARAAAELAARFEAKRAAGVRPRHRTPARAVGAATGDSNRTAAGHIRAGRATERHRDPGTGRRAPARFPALGRLMATGLVGSELVRAVVGVLDDVVDRLDPGTWFAAEKSMAEYAATHDVDTSVAEAKAVRDRLDALGVARRERELRAARSLVLGPERADGMTPIHGLIDPESAATVRAGIDALTHPRNIGTAPPGGPADIDGAGVTTGVPDGSDGPGGPDDRSHRQRAADALVDLIRRALSQRLPDTGGTRPQVVVTVPVSSLMTGEGTAAVESSSERLSAGAARRIACDAGILPAVLGGDGEVLDLGLTRRLFTAAQRRALALRDGGCIVQGCDRPPSWTDAHHTRHWADGGATDVDNAVLLCGFHHHDVHAGEIVVDMRPSAFGRTLPWIAVRDAAGRLGPFRRARNMHAPGLDVLLPPSPASRTGNDRVPA